MQNLMTLTIRSTDQKMGYLVEVPGRPGLVTDYPQPFGEDRGHTSLELLLAALANCTVTGVGMLLRKRKKTVTSLEVRAEADRAETHPTVFTAVRLRFTVHSPDVLSAEMDAVLKAAEETYCPVYVMLSQSVPVTAEYILVRD